MSVEIDDTPLSDATPPHRWRGFPRQPGDGPEPAPAAARSPFSDSPATNLYPPSGPPQTLPPCILSIVLCVPINITTRNNLMLSGEMVVLEYVESVEFPVNRVEIRD